MAANTFTASDTAQIGNQPAILYFRKYDTAGAYTSTIFTNSMGFTVTPGISTQAFDDTGDVYDYITEETGEISFDYGQVYNQTFFEVLGNGLYSIVTSAEGDTAAEDQIIASGWDDLENITLNIVNSAGTYFVGDSTPAITSIVGDSSSTSATVNDDYFIVADPNSKSGYSIMLVTTGTGTLANTESFTITYDTPSVIGQSTMTMGGVTNFDPIEGYIDTTRRDGTAIRLEFYRGFFNGKYNNSFASANDSTASITNVVISLKRDTTRDVGDQVAAVTVY